MVSPANSSNSSGRSWRWRIVARGVLVFQPVASVWLKSISPASDNKTNNLQSEFRRNTAARRFFLCIYSFSGRYPSDAVRGEVLAGQREAFWGAGVVPLAVMHDRAE